VDKKVVLAAWLFAFTSNAIYGKWGTKMIPKKSWQKLLLNGLEYLPILIILIALLKALLK
jgi:hypothetical protein